MSGMGYLPAPVVPGKGKGKVTTDPEPASRKRTNPYAVLEGLDEMEAQADFVNIEDIDEYHATHAFNMDEFEYDAKTKEIRSKYGKFVNVVKARELLDDLKFREAQVTPPGHRGYGSDFNTITARYDGVDGLTKKQGKHPSANFEICRKAAAMLVFDDFKLEQGTSPWFGGSLIGNNPKPWIHVQPVMSSQHPAIKIVLKYDPEHCGKDESKGDISCFFYPASIQRMWNEDGELDIKYQMRGPLESGHEHKYIAELDQHRQAGNLLQYMLLPWGDYVGRVKPNDPCPTIPVPPEFTGISLARVHEIIDVSDGRHQAEWNDLSDRERVISYLFRTKRFNVFRYWPSGGTDMVNNLRDWMDVSFWASIRYGSNWFYQLQSEKRLDASDFPLKDMTPPRWLADQMAVEFGEGGKLLRLEPHTWNGFKFDDGYVFPDAATGAFALRMMVARAKLRQSLVIRKAFPSDSFGLKGTFTEHPETPGHFAVAIWPGESPISVDRNLRPAPGSRCTLEVPTPSFERDGGVHKFIGEISRDIFCTGSDVNVIVKGIANLVEKGDNYERLDGWAKNDFKVCLKLIDDPTPSIRHMGTIEEIARGQEREDGLDIPALVLRCKRKTENTDALAQQIHGSLAAQIASRDVITRRGLNAKQVEAFTNAMGSGTGVTAVQGPPGCGKTRVLGAITESHVLAGKALVQQDVEDGAMDVQGGDAASKKRQVLVCAPANGQVDNAMDEIIGRLPPDHGLEIVRFRGAFLRRPKTGPEQMQIDEDDSDDEDEFLPEDDGGESPDQDDEGIPEATESEDEDDFKMVLIPMSDLVQRQQKERALVHRKASRKVLQKIANRDARLHRRSLRKRERLASEEMQRSMWQFADASGPFTAERNYEYRFYDKRRARIEQWAQTAQAAAPHHLATTAVRYLQLCDLVEQRAGDKATQKKNRSDKDDLEYWLTEEYIQKDVDILCCTNSASAENVLREFGRFKVILQDESPTCSIPEAATPLAVNIEWCQLFCMFGDFHQHAPMSTSKSANEWIDLATYSLFGLVKSSGLYEDCIVELEEQHRMHPELSRPLSKIFYGGSLRDAPSTRDEDRGYNTWANFLEPLKPAWNGNRRLAFDISGEDVESHRPDEGTSWANEDEANFVCRLVGKAIAHDPPANGDRLTPKDFLVVVFYGAQGGLISSKMFSFRINKENNRVMVENTRVVQGAEGKIVILSFARNIKGKDLDLGFIPEERGLCVALSRARSSLVMVGNFKSWLQRRIDEHELVKDKKSKLSYFGALLQDVLEQGDGISVDDGKAFLGGVPITEAELPSLLKAKGSNPLQARPIKQARTGQEMLSAFDRHEIDSKATAKEEEKAKKKNRRGFKGQSKSAQAGKSWYKSYQNDTGGGGGGSGTTTN